MDLRLGNVDLAAREITVQHGKGDKMRVVFIGNKVVAAIREYIQERPDTDSPYLFLSRKGGALSRGQVNRIFNAYSDTITPHTLRYFSALLPLKLDTVLMRWLTRPDTLISILHCPIPIQPGKR